ncbi:hypothetical protein WMH38_13945 [Staphylococcus aureus]
MSRPKMIYLEDEQNILDFHQKMTGGKLVVPYLTYDQLSSCHFLVEIQNILLVFQINHFRSTHKKNSFPNS